VKKMGWRCGLSGRVHTSQARSPEFKLQYQQKKEKKGKE
jgi:hypothetical protein